MHEHKGLPDLLEASLLFVGVWAAWCLVIMAVGFFY